MNYVSLHSSGARTVTASLCAYAVLYVPCINSHLYVLHIHALQQNAGEEIALRVTYAVVHRSLTIDDFLLTATLLLRLLSSDVAADVGAVGVR
jgi:hypothetical protein